MSKFWQKKYISKYTGAEIDAAVAKAGDATKVTANPSLAGTESALTGLEVGDTKYKIEAGGGSGVLVVTLTYNEATETVSCDKTFNEISAAFVAKTPMFLIPPEDPTIIPVQYYVSEEQIVIEQNFVLPTDIGGTPYAQISQFKFIITPNNVVTHEEKTVMCEGTTP